MAQAQVITQATHGDSLADILERVLNTGVVIVGDIKIKLCDVELLSIQLRLLICSVEKAQELGIPWWWEQKPDTLGKGNGRPKQMAEKPSPSADSPIQTPREEYERFHEFQRFREAERAFEEGPG